MKETAFTGCPLSSRARRSTGVMRRRHGIQKKRSTSQIDCWIPDRASLVRDDNQPSNTLLEQGLGRVESEFDRVAAGARVLDGHGGEFVDPVRADAQFAQLVRHAEV